MACKHGSEGICRRCDEEGWRPLTDHPGLSPLDRRCADALADEVAVLVRRSVIDSRSPAADALLDYRSPPSSPRADRLAAVERRLADAVTAGEKFLASLGEFVRQSMHANPEWRSGVVAMETFIFEEKKRARDAARPSCECPLPKIATDGIRCERCGGRL